MKKSPLTTRARRVAALSAAAAAGLLVATGAASGHGPFNWPWHGPGGEPRATVQLAATPESVQLVPLPCFSANVQIAMTNPGRDAVFADATVEAEDGLQANRGAFSSYLPAGYTAGAPVALTAPRTTNPGDYEVRVESGRARLTVPVTVAQPPAKGPGDNLAYGEQATASSTHGNFDVCGAVDGNSNSEEWDTLTGWNDGTSRVFPDTYAVQLAQPSQIDRVKLFTLDSRRYPAARYGLRDWDVQVRAAGGEWRTVAEVRGNSVGVVESTFDPVTADAVQIVGLSSNSGDYSRIVELEVRGG
jgi:hypothetical protein